MITHFGGEGGGLLSANSQQINKIVVWDTVFLFRVWTCINIEITSKNSGPNPQN